MDSIEYLWKDRKRRMRATELLGKPGGPAHIDCDEPDFDPEDDHEDGLD